MVKRLHSLTPAQADQVAAHAQRWVDVSLRTTPADRSVFEAAARSCYAYAGLPWHGNVVWVASPMSLYLAARCAALLLHVRRGKVSYSCLHSVRRAAGEDAWKAASAALRQRLDPPDRPAATGYLIEHTVAAPVRDAVWQSVGDQVRLNVSLELQIAINRASHSVHRAAWETVLAAQEEVASQAGRQAVSALKKSWKRERLRILDGCFSLGTPVCAAFTSFFRDVCGLHLAGGLWDRALAYERTLRNAYWWCPHRDFLLACDSPREIHLEAAELAPRRGPASRRLHRPHGPAISWPDGWSVYADHGRRVPGWIVEHPERITVAQIAAQRNAETRRVMIERYGWARYVCDSGAEVIDTAPMDHPIRGLRGARLLRKRIPGEPEPVVFLDMINSAPEPDGSFKHYLERIDPKAYRGKAGRSCHAAMASRWHHRDESGQLRRTFERWQDYRPLAES